MGETVAGLLLAAAIIGAFIVIGKAAVWLIVVMRKFARLVDDLTGEPPRPGAPEGRPGMLDRLASIEARVAKVEQQMEPNGGLSLRDAVDRLASPDGAAAVQEVP